MKRWKKRENYLPVSLPLTHRFTGPQSHWLLHHTSYFLSSHALPSLTLIHWLHRSPSPQVTMTEFLMSRFVTLLWSDHCCPVGSGWEADMQLGVFRISGSEPRPWVSFSPNTDFCFPLFSKFVLIYFITPPKTLWWSFFTERKLKNWLNTKAFFFCFLLESS